MDTLTIDHMHRFAKKGRILYCSGEQSTQGAIQLAKQGFAVEFLDTLGLPLGPLQKEAKKAGVAMTLRQALIEHWTPAREYDAVILNYVHLPPEGRHAFFHKAILGLKSQGILVTEAFGTDQPQALSHGPKDTKTLYGLKEMYDFFHTLPLTLWHLSQHLQDTQQGDIHSPQECILKAVLQKAN